MYARKQIVAVVLALLTLPALSSAQTIAELQAQLNQLMQLLAALQGASPSPVLTGGGAGNAACVYLSRDLGPNMEDIGTGGDVSRLQRYLAQNPAWYPEGRVTGFYGPLTTRAVQRFQASRGIVSYGTPETTGYGFVGPRTREFMARNCGNVPPSNNQNPSYIPPPPTSIQYQPLSGSVTVDFRLNQYYEAHGNGFFVRVVSIGASSVAVDVGTPRCGTPPWPSSAPSNTGICTSIGSVRQVSLGLGAPINVPIDNTALTLTLVQIQNDTARIIITPNAPLSPTPNLPVSSPITCTLASDKSFVVVNDPVTLTWASSNATAARWIQGPFVGTSIGVQGSATLSSLAETRPFTIEFTNAGGASKTCTVNVNVRNEPSINVSLPASGQKIGRGQTLAIAWDSKDVPLNARVRLELYSASSTMITGNNDNGILAAAPATGSYQWIVPSALSQSVTNTGFITGFPDGQYKVVAKLYTGDTCWGGCVSGSRTVYANGASAIFTVGTSTSSGGGGTDEKYLSVSPASGGIPLTVTVSTKIPSPTQSKTDYRIDFGNGTIVPVTACPASNGVCTQAGTNTVVYYIPSTYTIKLIKRTWTGTGPSDNGALGCETQKDGCTTTSETLAQTQVTVSLWHTSGGN